MNRAGEITWLLKLVLRAGRETMAQAFFKRCEKNFQAQGNRYSGIPAGKTANQHCSLQQCQQNTPYT